jgi:hypothetical protein
VGKDMSSPGPLERANAHPWRPWRRSQGNGMGAEEKD